MKLFKINNYNYKKKIIFKLNLIAIYSVSVYITKIIKVRISSPAYNSIYNKFIIDNFVRDENKNCDKYDPIFLMGERLKQNPIIVCKGKRENHICYRNSKFNYYNDISRVKYGIICKSENFILDPLKSNQTNYIYKGPVDKITRGAPILSKGFFNMNCKVNKNIKGFNHIYKSYFKAWDYNFSKENVDFKELSPGKTILFISRNQDSPNIFHGLSEIINVICIMYLFNLKPENIQIIFLESMKLQDDPFYELYKNIISRGGEPIYIKDLKQKYYISSAIHIPINWDSPLFINLKMKNGFPNCKYSTQTYNIFNNLINKYLKIPIFKDSFISDNKIYYYPKSIIQNFKKNIIFNYSITIQWRKVWPKGRKYQQRILGNGPELADKLSSILPNNYLIRLVDTASLPIIEQISIMRKTDYLIGVHGAGLSLSIFMPSHSVLHEILPKKNIKVLILMSALSGHKIYSDIIKSKLKIINNNDIYFFDEYEFTEKIQKSIKENYF